MRFLINILSILKIQYEDSLVITSQPLQKEQLQQIDLKSNTLKNTKIVNWFSIHHLSPQEKLSEHGLFMVSFLDFISKITKV